MYSGIRVDIFMYGVLFSTAYIRAYMCYFINKFYFLWQQYMLFVGYPECQQIFIISYMVSITNDNRYVQIIV